MNASSNPGTFARDRALAQARGITLGVLVAGVAAAGSFGALAALTHPATSTSTSTSDTSAASATSSPTSSATTNLQYSARTATQGGRGQVTTGSS